MNIGKTEAGLQLRMFPGVSRSVWKKTSPLLRQLALALVWFLALLTGGHCATNIVTQGYDNARTGQNLSEAILNTGNVSPATFGKLFTRAVDDEVYAQPLYLSGVAIPGRGTRNVLYIATVNNSVYAFDADDPSDPAPLWHVNLTGKEAGERPVKAKDVGQNCTDYHDFTENIGIVGTPVIDPKRQTLFLVTRTRKFASTNDKVARQFDRLSANMESLALRMERPAFAERLSGLVGSAKRPIIYAATGTLWHLSRYLEQTARAIETGEFIQRLHALDIANGVERPNSPVVIEATVPGTGRGSRNGKLDFRAGVQNQRGALLLANDTVYITWAAHCDTGAYHGWLIGYDPTKLTQMMAMAVTPNGKGGGIWQSNSGPSADASGNIYLTVGNGTASAPQGGQDYGNAFLKLSRDGTVLDWFIPFNTEYLNSIDGDVGASGVLLIPGTNLLTSGGKEGKLYLLDRDRLGHFQTHSDDQIEQILQLGGMIRTTPGYWDGPGGPYVYTWCYFGCPGQAFRLQNNRLSSEAVSQTSMVSGRGGVLSISANGTSAGSGILWANTGPLRAFDAADLSHELWNSEENARRDDFGDFAKFNTPVVANGKVYLATFSNQVAIYGLKPQGNSPPTVTAGDDQTVPLSQAATLSGTAKDDGSAPLSTSWLQVSGPGRVRFSHPGDLSTTARFSAPGAYKLRLTASDGTLATDADVTVTVTETIGGDQ